jgi:glycosyltransferase involved in cell wall biosynthesis
VTTAFIIDPAIQNYAGHHLTAAAGWCEAAQANGLQVRVLAHKDCVADSIGAVPIEKIFSGWFYAVAPADQEEAWKRLRVVQREFRDALTRPMMQVQPSDVAVLEHSTLVTLNGVAGWASGMPPKQLPRLAVWLMFGPQDEEFVVPFGSTDCLVAAIDRLFALFRDRLTLVGSTREVCKQWAALKCGAVHLLPFAALRTAVQARSDHAVSSPPMIVSMGHFGARKGLNLMPPLIRELDRRGIEVRWMIGGSSFEIDSQAFSEIARLAECRPNISVVTSPEGLKEYDNLLKSADLAVLPYSPEIYKERGSGVAEEAELLGLPYVAPKVAFSAEAVSAGAAVSFQEWTAEGVALAVVEALNKLPELSRGAAYHAVRAQERLRDAREKFLPLIFKHKECETPVIAAPAAPLPAVDIIVTLYNYRHFLRQCLESVNRQTYPDWRCIVVDDGSTDLTFHELRTLVRSFGERFSYERHGTSGGQLKAIATGLSLGSNPFVLMLDADDCLTCDALDLHLSWHLNSRVPAAFTSGRVQVIDELGRQLSGCLDNELWLDYADSIAELSRADAYRRPDAQMEPPSASFIRQNDSTFGRWFWGPSSALMFRRSVMEIVLPDSIEIGVLGADTYFGFASQAIGGSILIDKHVALYRRHGANGIADMGVYGAATMAARFSSSSWVEVAQNLRAHVQSNSSRFLHQIRPDHIDRLLAHTAPFERFAALTDKGGKLEPTPFSVVNQEECSDQLFAELARLRAIENSTLWRMTYPIRLALMRAPRIRRGLRAVASAPWRIGGWLRPRSRFYEFRGWLRPRSRLNELRYRLRARTRAKAALARLSGLVGL